MNGTDLGDHSLCRFEVASTVLLAALMEAEASVLDIGPFDLAMFWAWSIDNVTYESANNGIRTTKTESRECKQVFVY